MECSIKRYPLGQYAQTVVQAALELRAKIGSADEIAAWDLGVGCEGVVEILIEPVADGRDEERAMLDAEETVVLLTNFVTGARQVLAGSAADALSGADSRLLHDGSTGYFADVMRPPPRLLVVSAGDDARHLARLASDVDPPETGEFLFGIRAARTSQQ